ncbi:MAG TPA: hypothetical protein VGH08_03285 [Chthoniobacterales bacterium]|jgi:hypothetical protein
MKNHDDILPRLFRAAATSRMDDPQMPFGFDTRVLALAREGHSNGSAIIASLARAAAMIALVVIAIATAGLYRASESSSELPNGYIIADNAIQSGLGDE